MKRLLICILGAAAILAAALVFLFIRPDIASRIMFAAATTPVEMEFKPAYDVPMADRKTVSIAAAARQFLDSLDDSQRRAATYLFTDNAQRANWSNLPEGMVSRGGVKLGALSRLQRAKLDGLLGELLSEDGVNNITYQLAAEDTLVRRRSFGAVKYGSEHYYAAFLGEPSATEPWMFQFGGHHLAVNATVFGPHVSFSPMLTGGQPLHLRLNGEDIFITQKETAAAQALLNSLTEEQKAQAIRSKRPIKLQLGPGRFGAKVAPEGIRGSDLSAPQRQLLLDVIAARLGFINNDDSAELMREAAAEIEDTYFGWWGRQDVLGGAYFRVTGPSLVLEHAPRNDEGEVDHTHSIYREIGNDYGSEWIMAD